jgi:hypothetical protein
LAQFLSVWAKNQTKVLHYITTLLASSPLRKGKFHSLIIRSHLFKFLAGIIKSTCALLDKPLISPPLAIELSGLSLPPAHLFVLLVPMFLLTFNGAVGRVPAAPVDRFSLAVEALKAKIIL